MQESLETAGGETVSPPQELVNNQLLTIEEYQQRYDDIYSGLVEGMEDDLKVTGRDSDYSIVKDDAMKWAGTELMEDGVLSRQVTSLVANNSDLGSRILSLLLVCTGNSKEIIKHINEKHSHAPAISHGKGRLDEEAHGGTKDDEEEFRRLQEERRRRNTEASARFRIRKKLREQERLSKLKQLHTEISGMYRRIDELTEENQYWKQRLEKLNEKKSAEMLDNIKKRNKRIAEENNADSNQDCNTICAST
ncbi:HFR066Wp [Eremothecium sinecaudum]|uniref:HFR066Wp n=1 Tax=Eremothecium sinecaudum TaxID=45286 RepID=A0A0X8HUU3_9SACH|nr:HFR066Wp [Eremothecium sinecaudum]AMD21921.1 HFR066Wp [Eremothecium sinecaudum]